MDADSYEPFFDESDGFQETELDYVDRGQWEDLLDLYKRELDAVGAADEEEANDLRSRIEAVERRIHEDAENAQY